MLSWLKCWSRKFVSTKPWRNLRSNSFRQRLPEAAATNAAQILHIHRNTLARKLAQHLAVVTAGLSLRNKREMKHAGRMLFTFCRHHRYDEQNRRIGRHQTWLQKILNEPLRTTSMVMCF